MPAAVAATRPPPTNVSTPERMDQRRGRWGESGAANSGGSADHARSATYGRAAVGAVTSNPVAVRDAKAGGIGPAMVGTSDHWSSVWFDGQVVTFLLLASMRWSSMI